MLPSTCTQGAGFHYSTAPRVSIHRLACLATSSLCHSLSLSSRPRLHTAATMTRLLLSAVALAICLLTTSPIALARIVVSDVTFSACPGKEQLPLTTVDADVMVVSNSTVHIIGHMLSSINIDSAVCFINGTETAHGKTIVRGRVFDIQQLMITNEYLRIKAGSDLFIEAFTYFSMDMLPLRLESNLHVYDGSMQEINCELHGVTISYQEDDNDVVLNDTAALAARAVQLGM